MKAFRSCVLTMEESHKRENCAYSIHQDVLPKEMVGMESEKNNTRSCNSHGANTDKADKGPSGICA